MTLSPGDFGFMPGGFEIIFIIIFLLIVSMFVVMMVRGIGEWNNNNQSPRLTVDATVVAKRTNISHHHHPHGSNGNHYMGSTSSTTYYVTFQVDSGDRMELRVKGSEYGMLVEGDYGKLSFQGTRYLGFER